MRTRCRPPPATLISFFFYFTTFLVHAVSGDLPSSDGGCALNFSSYPYRPTGNCIADEEKITVWGGFPTTLCCRNALATLSTGFAHQAKASRGSIFPPPDEWTRCSGNLTFAELQPSVSVHACGFDYLFNGSNNLHCSGESLPQIEGQESYGDALKDCSQFGKPGYSFDKACGNCIGAIQWLRDRLLEKYKVKESGERAMCGVAVVTAVAAAKLDDGSLDDFFNCMMALDVFASTAKLMLATLLATIGAMVVLAVVKYVTKKTRSDAKIMQTSQSTKWPTIYQFTKAEIENAINIGGERKCLGRGSAGQVFQGVLPSGQVIAVKQIYRNNTSDSFTREVDGLSGVRHPNLVCLFGLCMEDGDQYLVYEYCSAGNLAQHLLRKDVPLTWERRVKILTDCALALKYLHQRLDGCLVHRDIKLTNILLTEKMDAKLSDFGLARMLNMEESKVFTDVRGTIGYMDPEYMTNAKLTCASDIYSFGIVMLQILSGQKVIELDLEARDQLTTKAKDVSMGKRPLSDFEDPRIKGTVNIVDFESILLVAVLCVARSSKGRPTIDVVYNELEKAWKNTLAGMRAKKENSTTVSRSTEVAHQV
ncbi:proline-rich receptor-like protein kinase PERK3 isoform X2 [Diospyros lotus]|uniref:proline-rich receptor-like protein kinase PERK3 isoform X2 n=1 Tax=Diospyros lotus TaxID=55363 RepID=UPI00224F3540|nr:proline-rich receptor-like protein kinase PERK3 isoform X2 [Diospyros lotus]